MRRQRPDRSTIIFAAALLASTAWIIASLVGLHPDGAILGFSGTMWAVWATTEKEIRKREERRERRKTPRRRLEDEDDEEDVRPKHRPWLS